MNKKITLTCLILVLIAGCADTYNINPVENQSVFINSKKEEPYSAHNPKIIKPNDSAKATAMINFMGKITLKKTNDLTSYIHKQMLDGVTEFVININSRGGDSDAGISAYQYLKQLPISITTYNTSNVQSSAALLYCSGNKRYALTHSFFMLHGSSTSYEKEMSFLEIEALGKLSKIHRQTFVDIFRDCTNLSTSQLEKYFASADLQYFTADEAKQIGLVLEISAPAFTKKMIFYNITD